MKKVLIIYGIVSLILVGVILYEIFIVLYPGEGISRERIQRIFSVESPVFYDDGRTIIGVFFQSEHRKYVLYKDLPQDFINALLAAEDKHFFSHPGFDPVGILRALWLNIKAGRVVQGGSTITQQTAKNLFKREKRSIWAKLKELIHALKLEAHYSKEQILEWYVNQFYVNGNGRGIGIAAEYFFNKDVKDLTLVECAFLAGCIKAPNRYNPFIKKTEEARQRARRLAKARKDHVLKAMYSLGMITEAQLKEALAKEVPFKEGRIRYPLNTILDEVRDRLNRPPIIQALREAGIDNIATSGIRIFTTINRELQEACLLALREGLSFLETKLSGYRRDEVVKRYNLVLGRREEVERKPFMFAQVVSVSSDDGKEVNIEVKLPNGLKGIIGEEGLSQLTQAVVQGMRGTWANPRPGDAKILLSQIVPGDPVFVRELRREDSGPISLSLEQYPEINGGVLVLQNGRIKALVGGFDNIHFNRALDARRQVGSVFKPLVYLAALQLGWNTLDPLLNRWQAFPYQQDIYIPKPDHKVVHDPVSMAWAGVKSENIATVWLLYHLCDKLTLAQFKELARHVALLRRDGESRSEYIKRIRDRMGILVNEEAIRQAAFEEAKEEVITDLTFEGETPFIPLLQDLHYGIGVSQYMKREDIKGEMSLRKDLEEEELQSLRILMHNYLRLWRLNESLKKDYSLLVDYLSQDYLVGMPPPLDRFYWKIEGGVRYLCYTDYPLVDGLIPMRLEELPWTVQQEGPQSIPALEDILVDGRIPSRILDTIAHRMEDRLRELKGGDPYDIEVLSRIRDFRVLVGLRYVVDLARRMGVESTLEEVLSIPLGANSITLEDAARLYQTLVSGAIFMLKGAEPKNSTILIERIEGPDGEIIYKAEVHRKEIMDPRPCYLVADILRNVVMFGTGRAAKSKVILSLGVEGPSFLKEISVRIPAFGKTGTSDNFTNSSFVGYLPGVGEDGSSLTMDGGVVIAAYVGYDDNRPMENPVIRVFGASGALPIWIKVANATVRALDYPSRLDVVDLAFNPKSVLEVSWPKGLRSVSVDPRSGLPSSRTDGGPKVLTYFRGEKGKLLLERSFCLVRWPPKWRTGNGDYKGEPGSLAVVVDNRHVIDDPLGMCRDSTSRKEGGGQTRPTA